jgi:hypothetical protein
MALGEGHLLVLDQKGSTHFPTVPPMSYFSRPPTGSVATDILNLNSPGPGVDQFPRVGSKDLLQKCSVSLEHDGAAFHSGRD